MKPHQNFFNTFVGQRWIKTINIILSLIIITGMLSIPPVKSVFAQSLLDTDFNSDSGGFVYQDDTFGTSQASYASGSRITGSSCYGGSGGCLNVKLGGVNTNTITNMSGGWKYTFNLASAEAGVTIDMRYRLVMPAVYDFDEYSRVQVSLDGVLYGRGSKNYVDHTGGDNTFAHDTGWVEATLHLGDLSAGSHTLIIGGFNNKKTYTTEITDIYIDDVAMNSGASQPVVTDVQQLVDRLDLNGFKLNVQNIASYGDRNRMSTSYAPYTSYLNALNWVSQKLTDMGYEPQVHTYSYSGWTGWNLYATKVGTVHPDQMYIVSTHLDGRGGGGAANDDGSGVALLLEMARVLAGEDVETDISVRFLFFDQEEIGLYGSKSYVTDRRPLQGIESPAGSGKYPEPTWLGIIQHDMVMYDHGVGTVTTNQSPYADLDVEWRDGTTFASQSKVLAQAYRYYNGEYAEEYPANSANNSTNTDDTPFQPYVASVSVRENRRGLSGEWINPYYHRTTDVYSSYLESDFRLGFNAVQSTLGTVAELAGARIVSTNQPPVANSQTVTTNEDTSKSIILTGSDPDSDPLTYSLVSSPAHGNLTGTAPNVVYTPVANYSGVDSFSFRVNDGKADSAPATVSIIVNAVNDPPVANAQSVTTNEDTSKSIVLTGSDPDGNPLTYGIVTAPTHGSLSGTVPNLTYSPAANYYGNDSFTFRVNDGTVNSAIATVSITVLAVNDPPTAITLNLNTTEDNPIAVVLSGSDIDGDTLTFSVFENPTNGTLTGSVPNLTYTPDANFNGTDSFKYVSNDGSVNSSPATVNLVINPVNDLPIANAQSLVTQQDSPVSFDLTGDDIDGDSLTFTVVNNPTHGTLTGAAPSLVYTPDQGFIGDDILSFVVNDGQVNSVPTDVLITVTRTNHQPVADPLAVSTDEDTALGILLTGHDPDNDPITFQVIALPQNGVLSGNAPNLTYAPIENFNGEDTFSFITNDGAVDSAVATVTIIVAAVNDAPVAELEEVNLAEDTSVSVTLRGTDLDADLLTFNLISGPANGVLSGTLPFVTYTPAANYFGSDSFEFSVSDGELTSAGAWVSFTVTPVNDAPTAFAQSVVLDEDGSKPIQLSGVDIDSATLSYIVVNNPMHGTLSGTMPALTYTPAANYFGTDTFTFKVSDGLADSTVELVSITVNAINDAPTALDDAFSTSQNTDLVLNKSELLANDSDVDNAVLNIIEVMNPTNGSLSMAGEVVTFVPTAGFVGSAGFTYVVSDGELTNIAHVIVTVNPVGPLTVFTDDFETDKGWTRNVNGTDTATTGQWERAIPESVVYNGDKQLSSTVSGAYDLVTGPLAGSSAGSYDIDGGATSMRSPAITLPTGRELFLSASYYLSHYTNATTDDFLRVSIIGTSTQIVFQELGANNNDDALWEAFEADISAFAGQTIYILIEAGDMGSGSLVEAAIDDVLVMATNPNTPPVANAQTLTLHEDTPLVMTLSGTDADNDTITYEVKTMPSNGALTGTAPNLTYIPSENYFGTDSFSFVVNDGKVDSEMATVALTILSVNDVPVADPQSVSTVEDTNLAITLTGSDVDSSTLTYSIVSGPAHGSLTGTLPNVIYIPTSGFTGSDSFTFMVNDGVVNSAAADVTIIVNQPGPVVVFFDDFENNNNWVRNPNGDDTATVGLWERANPESVSYYGDKQLGTTVSGSYCLVTGPLAGSSAGSYDIDNGATTIRSPYITLPSTGNLTLSFSYYLAHANNSSTADYLRVRVVGSTSTLVLQELGATNDDDAAWITFSGDISAFRGQTIYVLIEAADASGASLVEAAIDDLMIMAE